MTGTIFKAATGEMRVMDPPADPHQIVLGMIDRELDGGTKEEWKNKATLSLMAADEFIEEQKAIINKMRDNGQGRMD